MQADCTDQREQQQQQEPPSDEAINRHRLEVEAAAIADVPLVRARENLADGLQDLLNDGGDDVLRRKLQRLVDNGLLASPSAHSSTSTSRSASAAQRSRHAAEGDDPSRPQQQQQLKQLKPAARRKVAGIHRTRGDGNCFYRAVLTALALGLRTTARSASASALTAAPSTEDGDAALAAAAEAQGKMRDDMRHFLTGELTTSLEAVGFSSIVFEDFVEDLVRLVCGPTPTLDASATVLQATAGQRGGPEAEAEVIHQLNDEELSASAICALRLAASAFVRSHPDDFYPFLLAASEAGDVVLERWCEREIEAFGSEADHLPLTALCRAFAHRVDVQVVYLDRSAGEEVVVHSFASDVDGERSQRGKEGEGRAVDREEGPAASSKEHGDKVQVCILYRPGHYDLLLLD